MVFLLAALGGIVAGLVLRRFAFDLPTRFIFNVVVFALIIAQTVLFLFRKGNALSNDAILSVILVLWSIDMVFSWHGM